MGKRENVLFTKEHDEILETVYQTKGGKAARQAIIDKFGSAPLMHQIHSRCGTLGYHSGFRGRPVAGPIWEHASRSKPIKIACWFVLEYIGYRKKTKKSHHTYKAQARCCGTEYERIQETILDAEKEGRTMCPACAREKQSLERKDRQQETLDLEQQSRQDWIEMHQAIRPLSPEFWTDDDWNRNFSQNPYISPLPHRNRHPHL